VRGENAWQEAAQVLQKSGYDLLEQLHESLISKLKVVTLREWTEQYERCFGHTAHSKVPPYELEYGEEHSHRQPQELADIAAFFHAFGLQVSQQAHERVDHISVECEFMSFLLYKEDYALEHDGEEKAMICRQASVDFLSRHLGRWAVSFALRLSQHAGQTLMGRIGDFAFSFINRDCQLCGVQAGPSDLPVRLIQEKEETGCTSCSLASPR
jgi:TorA maturation chaperone TorD